MRSQLLASCSGLYYGVYHWQKLPLPIWSRTRSQTIERSGTITIGHATLHSIACLFYMYMVFIKEVIINLKFFRDRYIRYQKVVKIILIVLGARQNYYCIILTILSFTSLHTKKVGVILHLKRF